MRGFEVGMVSRDLPLMYLMYLMQVMRVMHLMLVHRLEIVNRLTGRFTGRQAPSSVNGI